MFQYCIKIKACLFTEQAHNTVLKGHAMPPIHQRPDPSFMPARIRPATGDDVATLGMLISESNKRVAAMFGLDAQNCPKHPSLCTEAWVEADMARGERYFLHEDAARAPLGCVAYESAGPGRAYLNRLSVLPTQQARGIGARLVAHILEHARSDAVGTISIGVIDAHTELQRWYGKQGFVAGDIRHFAHLPFAVRYMTLAL
jgi:GNAT superfamily N-acetyltransferase